MRIFKLAALIFFLFLKHHQHLILNTWITFGTRKPAVPQMFVRSTSFMAYTYVFMHSVKVKGVV